MLRAGARVGETGTWKDMQLPEFPEIGTTVGYPDVVRPTIKRRRFHTWYSHMSSENLEALIRNAMNLSPRLWPYGVSPRGWCSPLVIHHGLAKKFARNATGSISISSITSATRWSTRLRYG
ncbi:MAG: hypothetical protein QOD51_2000 [Candidatus Eremiobacteraeota bacterium]|nr:hypothetical protein [Candidatus Eremiobacteraeota bacterium]